MILKALEKIKPQVEQAEIFWQEAQSLSIEFENDFLKNISSKESSGGALRIFKNNRIGFSTGNKIDDFLFKTRKIVRHYPQYSVY